MTTPSQPRANRSSRRLPSWLRAGPVLSVAAAALPVATVWAALSLSGAHTTRYSSVALPAAQAPWVVERAEGSAPGACQLAVQVVDAGSAAQAMLRLVRATPTGASDVWTATTNRNGAHRFVDLPDGVYHLSAFTNDPLGDRAPDNGAAPVVLCQHGGARVFAQVPLVHTEHVLSGQVVSLDRRGVSGAEIAFQQETDEKATLAGVLRVPVRPDGSFQVRLAPGRYVAQITAPHHTPQTRKLRVDAGDTVSRLVARLAPAPQVSGRVVDETGAPLPGAWVALGGSVDPKAKQTRVRADESGRFTLPVRLGAEALITARGGGRVAQASFGVVQRPFGIDGVTLVAQRGRAVQGVVTRPDGSAAAFSEVRFRVRELGLTGTERADAGGRFVLDGMPAGSDVEVWAEGNATGAWGAQVASPGNDMLALVFVPPAY